MEALGGGQVAQRPQGGVHEQAFQGLQKAGEAVGQAIDQDAAHDGGDIEQDELGHAPHAGPPHAAEDDVERHEGDGDEGGAEMVQGEDGGQQGGGAQDLGHDADEDADGAEDAARRLGGGAVFLRNDLQQRLAPAAAEGGCVAQGQDEAADAGA